MKPEIRTLFENLNNIERIYEFMKQESDNSILTLHDVENKIRRNGDTFIDLESSDIETLISILVFEYERIKPDKLNMSPTLRKVTDKYLQNNNPTKGNTMNNNNNSFTTEHYVNGNNINDLTDDGLINAINSLENNIKVLKKIKTKSKMVNKTIKGKYRDIRNIVKHMDKRA